MPRPAWLNRNVIGMTVTSLFSDMCYEMVLAILPGFLPVIHVAAAALGWIEGVSDALASFLKLAAGWYSDRIGRRKWVVAAGYLFTGSGLSLFAFAKSWPLILIGRLISWFGKGIRGSLRNAMLTESVPPEVRGKAFGFHRSGDTVGAILGPLMGVALLHVLPQHPPDLPFRTIFLLSLIPGLAAPLAFALMVRDTGSGGVPGLGLGAAIRGLPRSYYRFLIGVGVFGMGDFSPTLLVLAATTILSPGFGPLGAAETAALLYTVRNIVYAAGSFPVGALADRLNKRMLLAMGYMLGGLTAFAMAFAFVRGVTSVVALGAIFVLSGLFAAAQDTLEGAVPPEFVPEAEKGGTVYGVLGGVNGVGDLIASAMVGTVWTLISPVTAFSIAALLMLAGARLVAAARPTTGVTTTPAAPGTA